MRITNTLARNIFSLTAAEAANKVFTLLYQMYLARVLSPIGYGYITFAQTIVLWLSGIMIFGLEIYGSREIAKNHNNLPSVVNSITSYKLLTSIIMYGILIGITLLIEDSFEAKLVLLIAGINLFTNAILLTWAFQGLEKMEIIALRQFFTSGMSFIGIVIFVNDPDDLIISMLALSASLFVNAFWMLLYYNKKFQKFKFKIDVQAWKSMLRTAAPIGIGLLVVAFYNYLNIFMLKFMKGESAVGIYASAFKMLSLGLVPTAILQGAFFPQFSKTFRNEERLAIMNKYFFLLMLIGFLIAFTVINFADFILVIVGNEYQGAQNVLRLLMVALILMYLNVAYSAPLLAWNKEKQVMYSLIAGGVSNMFFNLILINAYGVYGAAISSILSELAVFVGLSYNFRKLTGKLMIYHLAKFLLISIIAGAPAYFILYFGVNPYLAGAVSITVFGLFLLFDKDVNIKEIKGALKG